MSATGFTEERLRQELAASAETGGRNECPSPELLVRSARGELSRRRDSAVILHIGACTACAAGWRVAREVAGQHAGKMPASPFTWARWAAAAALLAVAVGGGVLLFSPDRTGPAIYREQLDETIRSALPEDVPLPRDGFLLRWTSGPEGSIYDVLVTDERMNTLARGLGLDEAEYFVPETALADLRPNDRVLWQVSARLPDGRRIESPTFIAVLR
jgi:hypothetical protein